MCLAMLCQDVLNRPRSISRMRAVPFSSLLQFVKMQENLKMKFVNFKKQFHAGLCIVVFW